MSTLDQIRLQDAQLRELPPSLWERLRADPVRAPEHIALAAPERHAPAAAAWLADKRRDVRGHAGRARADGEAAVTRPSPATSGAATGAGGFITIVPDLAAAAWIQSRLMYFVAASYGYDPFDPMRPAEQLVLRGLYATPSDARSALDGIGHDDRRDHGRPASSTRQEALTLRLAKMVGKRAVRRSRGRLIPGIAIAFNAIGNERDTRALADKAIAFYGG